MWRLPDAEGESAGVGWAWGFSGWQVGELPGQVLMLTDERGGGPHAPPTAAAGVIILTGVN